MRYYRVCGLDVSSELVLPGAIAAPSIPAEADFTVRRAPVPENLEGATLRGPNWAMAGERFLLHVPGVARYLMTGGREIAVELADGRDEAEAALFLLGTAFGVLMYQRGRMVLHASAVRVGGKAILLCGESGAGKSTLAAALEARGYPCINDDVCCLSFADDGSPSILPDGRMIKLWSDAVERLELGHRRGAAVRAQLAKYYVEPSHTVAEECAPVPVAAIYALREDRPPLESGIAGVNAVDAALLLRRNTYRAWLMRKMGLDGRHFQDVAAVQRHAGIFHLTRPLDFARMPEVIGWLEAHWSERGYLRNAA